MADIAPEPEDLPAPGSPAVWCASFVEYLANEPHWEAPLLTPDGKFNMVEGNLGPATACHPAAACLYDQANEPGPLRTFWRLMTATWRAGRNHRDA
jgi:hypothetical protein